MSLRKAAEMALEALEGVVKNCWRDVPGWRLDEIKEQAVVLRAALAEADEPDLSKCPNCGGPADNGHDRCVPPNPYWCVKCETHPPRREPLTEDEPVAWRYKTERSDKWIVSQISPEEAAYWNDIKACEPLYTHPPKREPLTEEQVAAIRREIAIRALVDLTAYEARLIARIIERAHGIGGDE